MNVGPRWWVYPVNTLIAPVAGMRPHRRDVDPRWIGRARLETWSEGAERARRVRRAHGPGRFLDLPHGELTAEPVGVAERAWHALGAGFDAESRARTPRHIRRDRRRNPGGHRYGPERHGIDPDRVRAVFGPDPIGAGAARG